jgi:hypothetical protein
MKKPSNYSATNCNGTLMMRIIMINADNRETASE